MELNRNSRPRPDGLFYEINNDRLVIRFLFESKTGSRRGTQGQALRFLNSILNHGLSVPEGHYEKVYLLNQRDELIPLRLQHQNLFFDSYFVYFQSRMS